VREKKWEENAEDSLKYKYHLLQVDLYDAIKVYSKALRIIDQNLRPLGIGIYEHIAITPSQSLRLNLLEAKML
jgi:hypothetical protein